MLLADNPPDFVVRVVDRLVVPAFDRLLMELLNALNVNHVARAFLGGSGCCGL